MTTRGCILALALVAGGTLVSLACTTTGALNDLPSPTVFAPSSDSDAAVGEGGLIQYCPSSECPSGFTTCPSSGFRCDVDLRNDPRNCGECGVRCPPAEGTISYTCVEGQCALICQAGYPTKLDCNHIVDDGCETPIDTNENCGACGNKCTDPKKPCVDKGDQTWTCGCEGDLIPCKGPWGNTICINPNTNDANCNVCANACDPTGNGAPSYPHTRYGCDERECGRLKCTDDRGNCDGRIDNGCETPLWTDDNCGVCGNHCPDRQFCAIVPMGITYVIQCVCPEGMSFCDSGDARGNPPVGVCRNLTSDPENCGGCGLKCPSALLVHGTMSCEFGACKLTCPKEWSDCNGNLEDECETNTGSDPKNCGGCGRVCDAVAGQACVQGRCVVAPCGPDGGPVAR